MKEKSNQLTKRNLKKEMSRIRSLWSTYILKYDSLRSKTWSPENINSSYVGTILGNFIDTFDVIYDRDLSSDGSNNYAGSMSLMQAIYIQQDIMEEMLQIFRCNIVKGNLKEDENYSINRNIRNELMGHPIRRDGLTLTSTTLFAYNGAKDSINYIRHHKDTGFGFEMISHGINEIIDRHTIFVNTYFDKILNQIKNLLKPFQKKLIQIMIKIDVIEFEKLIKFTDQCFESIYNEDYGYENLVEVHNKRNQHPRYQHIVDSFRRDLKEQISEHLENINNTFNPKEELTSEIQAPVIINIVPPLDDEEIFGISSDSNSFSKEYEYYVTKLIDMDDRNIFPWVFSSLKKMLPENKIVHEELDNMMENLNNDLEYYCSYRFIRNELKMDDD